jgi:hypothetical protein
MNSILFLPSQYVPLPEKPFKHEQLNDPGTFVQIALE